MSSNLQNIQHAVTSDTFFQRLMRMPWRTISKKISICYLRASFVLFVNNSRLRIYVLYAVSKRLWFYKVFPCNNKQKMKFIFYNLTYHKYINKSHLLLYELLTFIANVGTHISNFLLCKDIFYTICNRYWNTIYMLPPLVSTKYWNESQYVQRLLPILFAAAHCTLRL